MFKWLKWYFVTTKQCEHNKTQWYMINCGMGKAEYCDDCGKCIRII
jgi:hypothetical protein